MHLSGFIWIRRYLIDSVLNIIVSAFVCSSVMPSSPDESQYEGH
jgi:hypothetical protein